MYMEDDINKEEAINILIVSLCDEWKSWDSMRVAGIIKNEDLAPSLLTMMKNNVIESDSFNTDDEEEFYNKVNETDIRDLNDLIKFLYLQEVTVGEIRTDGGTL